MKGLERKIILVILILVSFVLFTPASASSAEPVKFDITLAGATPAGNGIWDMMGAGFAEAIMRGNKGSLVTVAPGSSVSDIIMVGEGEAELGLTSAILIKNAEEGTDPFTADKTYDNIRTLFWLYSSQFHIIANPDLGIDSFDEVIEKKIPIRFAVGDPGGGGEIGTQRMLQAYGMSYEALESWGCKIYYKDFGEANDMYKDDLVNVMVQTGIAPMAPLTELAFTEKVKLLKVGEKIIKEMADKYGYTPGVIKAERYDFLDEDIRQFESPSIIITSIDVPEGIIYNVTRAMIENLDYVGNIHIRLKPLTPEMIAEGLLAIKENVGANLHPEAEKYFKEIGAIK